MNKAKRILYVNGGLMDRGGISQFMMNYYRHMDHERLQIDFLSHGTVEGDMDEEIRSLGGIVYHIPTKRDNLFKNINGMKAIFSMNQYKLVHSHMDGMNGLTLKLAKDSGVPIRISHSHGTDHDTKNKARLVLHESARKMIPRYATHCWACSSDAGDWLYGNRTYEIIPNAIEMKNFRFNEEVRTRVRRELGINDKYVVGYVGTLHPTKNQIFLLEVMREVVKLDPNILLLLVGDGVARPEIEKAICKLNLAAHVKLLGLRDDVSDLQNAFDVIAFPSLWEGMPISLVEAQTNGLPCIVSDSITREVNLTDRTEFIPLEKTLWVKKLLKRRNRKDDDYEKVRLAGYDIEATAEKLFNAYMKMLEAVG